MRKSLLIVGILLMLSGAIAFRVARSAREHKRIESEQSARIEDERASELSWREFSSGLEREAWAATATQPATHTLPLSPQEQAELAELRARKARRDADRLHPP